jgi:uncharacterized protein (DUF1778 family)
MAAQAAARTYLELQADERLELRIPGLLKHDAEAVARAHGQRLAQYLIALIARHVAEDARSVIEWTLTPLQQAELLRILASPAPTTPALEAARERARDLFGPDATL